MSNRFNILQNRFTNTPLLSKDNKEIIVSDGPKIEIFDANTNSLIRKIETHEKSIVFLSFLSDDFSKIVSASKNRAVIHDLKTTSTTNTLDINPPIFLAAPVLCAGKLIFASKRKTKDPSTNPKTPKFGIYSFDITQRSNSKRTVRLFATRFCDVVSASKDGQFVLVAAKGSIVVWRDGQKIRLPTNYRVTCMDVSSSADIFATGDVRGVVRVYHIDDLPFAKNGGEEKRLTEGELLSKRENGRKRKRSNAFSHSLHWHAHPVKCIAFSADGSHFLTGGREGVLVVWQVESGKRDYFPRMGAGIAAISISPDEKYFCVRLENCTVKLIDSVRESVEGVVSGLCLSHSLKNAEFDLDINVCPVNGALTHNCHPGAIQFFDYERRKNNSLLQIIPFNVIAGPPSQPVHLPYILRVAFSKEGMWMATVDWRRLNVIPTIQFEPKEFTLRLHSYDTSANQYRLHSIENAPHEFLVVKLEFNPSNPRRMYTCDCTEIKLWKLSKREKGPMDSSCESAFDYFWRVKRARNLGGGTIVNGAYSGDGSVIAVVLKEKILLLNSDNLETAGELVVVRHKTAPFFYFEGVILLKDLAIAWGAQFAYMWDLESLSLIGALDVGDGNKVVKVFSVLGGDHVGIIQNLCSKKTAALKFYRIEKSGAQLLSQTHFPLCHSESSVLYSDLRCTENTNPSGVLFCLGKDGNLRQSYLVSVG